MFEGPHGCFCMITGCLCEHYFICYISLDFHLPGSCSINSPTVWKLVCDISKPSKTNIFKRNVTRVVKQTKVLFVHSQMFPIRDESELPMSWVGRKSQVKHEQSWKMMKIRNFVALKGFYIRTLVYLSWTIPFSLWKQLYKEVQDAAVQWLPLKITCQGIHSVHFIICKFISALWGIQCRTGAS